MKKLALFTLLILTTLLLSGCPVPKKKDTSLDETIKQYESMVRWSQWDGAVSMIDPEYLAENPVSNLEMERLRLFRVTNYTIRSATPADEGNSFLQVVEIRMFNKNQAREKSIIDQQTWKWNEEAEVWLLHSGLPDPTKRH